MSKENEDKFEEGILGQEGQEESGLPAQEEPSASKLVSEEPAESAPEAAGAGEAMGEIGEGGNSAGAKASEEADSSLSAALGSDGTSSSVEERADGEEASFDPFENQTGEIPTVEEVAAADSKVATAPVELRSSVKIAMDQRPPRLAKPKVGPRTLLLATQIPEVIIPTNFLETREFAKVNVTEGVAEAKEEPKPAEGEAALGENESSSAAPESGQDGKVEGSSSESSESPEIQGAGKSDSGKPGNVDSSKDASKKTDPSVTKRPRKKIKISKGKVIVAAIVVVVLAVAAVAGAFAWDRWFRYDDTQDVIGEWKMANAERTMVFAKAVMKIDDDVNYKYTLDTKEKTITYSFGDKEATATYRFSPDRKTLIIDESGKTDWLVALHLKEDPLLEDRDVPEGVTKLVKLSDDPDAQPTDTEEIIVDEEDIWSEGTYIGTYFEFDKPKLKDQDKKKKSGSGADANNDGVEEDDDDDDENSDGAAYVDDVGNRYYFDSTQMLYYDQYGNFYYDMYGNNPYEVYTEEPVYEEPVYEEPVYEEPVYDDSYYGEY